MTHQEFFQRTGVEVSAIEYEAIESVYNFSDLDKDEFCKIWKKMNRTRVEAAKVERMKQQRDEAFRNALYKFYDKNYSKEEYNTPITYVKISAYEIQALSYAGINVKSEFGYIKSLSDIRYDVAKYLGIY